MTQTHCDKCKEDSLDLKQCPICEQSLCNMCWGDKLQLFCSHCCEKIKNKDILFKICSKCKIEQPTTEFCKNKIERDGLNRICKSCEREYHKDYTQTKQGKKIIQKALNKYFKTDKGKEGMKRWLKTKNGQEYLKRRADYYKTDEGKKHQQQYYQTHKKQLEKYNKEYYETHKETIKTYQKTNREKINASRRKHYAEKKEENK